MSAPGAAAVALRALASLAVALRRRDMRVRPYMRGFEPVSSLPYSRVSEFLIVVAPPSVCDPTDDGVSRAESV